MLITTFFSILIYYATAFKIQINSVGKNISFLSLFAVIFALVFLGNFFTYNFLFYQSDSNLKILIFLNKLFSNISFVNSKIDEYGLYNGLIDYDKTNDYMLMNICSYKDKIKLFMTGMPNYHCMNFTRLIYGSGFIFLIFIYNSLKISKMITNYKILTLNSNDKIAIYFYFLSSLFYVFSLTYVDMLSGSYMLHSRTRFLEVANLLILFNFIIIFSKDLNINDLIKKIVIFIILIKFLLPFSLNLKFIKHYNYIAPLYYDLPYYSYYYYNNWYINQWKKNFKYILRNI